VAGVYSPTITTFPAPVVTIESQDATSYDTIQRSLISTIYVAKGLELIASSNEQIVERLYFESYDSNGDLKNFVVSPAIDPYQYQKAIDVDLSEKGVIFDGKTKMGATILPASSIRLDIEVAQVSPSGIDKLGDAIDSQALENFKQEHIFQNIEALQESIENTVEYDFLNRSGFFEDLNTSLSECYPRTIQDLFTDFRDTI
jgi:hypothetical protein